MDFGAVFRSCQGQGVPELADESSAGAQQPPESAEERLLEAVMLRLRLSDGLDFRILEEQFGVKAATTVESALLPHIEKGLAEPLGCGNGVRLKDPEGFLVSNDIISDIFVSLETAK